MTKGLELLATLPEHPTRTLRELDFLVLLGPALTVIKGFAASEVEQLYSRARELCDHIEDTPGHFSILRGLWNFYNNRGIHVLAQQLGEQLIAMAQRLDDMTLRLIAHQGLGRTLYPMGEIALARVHLEQGIACAASTPQRDLAVRYGMSPVVQCLNSLAHTLWLLGYPDQAVQRCHEACTRAEALDHAPTLGAALFWAAVVYRNRREAAISSAFAERLITLAAAQGLGLYGPLGLAYQGSALVAQGQFETGIAHIGQGIDGVLMSGNESARPVLFVILADAYRQMGNVQTGLQLLDQAHEVMQTTGQYYYEIELYQLRGDLLNQADDSLQRTETTPEDCWQRALDLAHRRQAKSWELRAATSLARLWQQQGKRQEAYKRLASLYAWFTEGFDTADLIDAKRLLDELSADMTFPA